MGDVMVRLGVFLDRHRSGLRAGGKRSLEAQQVCRHGSPISAPVHLFGTASKDAAASGSRRQNRNPVILPPFA